MKKFRYFLLTVGFSLLAVTGYYLFKGHCSVYSVADYNNWLNNERNGCMKDKTIAGIKITVKYQPPSYITLKELKSSGSALFKKDSILKIQNNMLTFLMTLNPDEEGNTHKQKEKSVMYKGIDNYGEYVNRVMSANFNMDQNIKLYIDNVLFTPVLAIVENVYELSDGRNFIIVFAPRDEKAVNNAKELLFIYDDPYFNMGKVQFAFSGNDLKNGRSLNVHWK